MMDSGALTSGYGALWTGGVIYRGMAGMMTIYGDIYILFSPDISCSCAFHGNTHEDSHAAMA